ncbi:hypothetical protein VNO78_19940 [Psophocarpus tetragonolobus]|uniref:Uncharacterized protein n=1 Tax=Psophocarpus tetragonolobus TaxID=3891 RepID=A0AAN9XGN0_PSOTE
MLNLMDLEDLLRASAYAVGKSKSGIAYKVVDVEKGSSMVVFPNSTKVMTHDGSRSLNEFEAIARVRHPNVVLSRAYLGVV